MSRIAFVTTSTALLALAMAIAPLSARAAGTTPPSSRSRWNEH